MAADDNSTQLESASESASECVNALVEEYMDLQRQGTVLSINEFVSQHPEHAAELHQLLETVLVVNQLGPQPESRATGDFPEIADYQLLRIAGRGGMGVVYEAIQISLERRVAVKILPNSLLHKGHARERFQLEARTAAKLHHTNIVPVFEVGEHNGHCFYAMQFIEGETLDTVVDRLREIRRITAEDKELGLASPARRQLAATTVQAQSIALSLDATELRAQRAGRETGGSPQAIVDTKLSHTDQTSTASYRSDARPFFLNVAQLGRQAASALHYAHEHGIVHRDVKPSNLILDLSGHLWISDFGLAKLTDVDDLTQAGDVVGTLRYMSPERFYGKCDGRSDIYSLGVTLYELIALRPPFQASDRAELVEQIKEGNHPKLRAVNRRIPYDLQTIVEKAMHPVAARRYATAQALADDLHKFVNGEPIRARRVNTAERLWLWAVRNPTLATLSVCMLLGLVTVSIVSSVVAVKFMHMANDQLRLTGEAITSRAESIRNLYYAETNLAAQDIELRSGIVNIRAYVDRWKPTEGQVDPRGWEWHLLNSLAHREEKVIDLQIEEGLDRPAAVAALAYSNDGKYLAHSSNYDVVIRDDETLRECARLTGHTNFIKTIQFSPDGKRIATTSDDRTMRIWDRQSSQLIHRVDYPARIESVSWHPHAEELVFTVSGPTRAPKSLHVVDASSGQIKISKSLQVSDHARTSGYSRDGKLFAVPIEERNIYSVFILETENWTRVTSKELHAFYMSCHFSNGELPLIASASLDRTVRIWNYISDTTELVHESSDGIPAICWSPDGNSLAIASRDHTLNVWDNVEKRLSRSLPGHQAQLTNVVWHPYRDRLISADSRGILGQWNLSETSGLQEYQIAPAAGDEEWLKMSVDWSPDGSQLAVGNGHSMKVWNFASRRFPTPSIVDQQGSFPEWSPDGRYLASAAETEALIWNADATNPRRTSVWGKDHYRFLAWWHDSQEILITEINPHKRIYLWRLGLEQGSPTRFAGPFGFIQQIDYSPDGRFAALAIRDSNFLILETATGKVVREIQTTAFATNFCVAWSPDGSKIAIAGSGQVVEIWSTENWERQYTLTGHTFDILSLAWNPAGDRLASASRDKTIRIWETVSFKTTLVLRHATELGDLSWSPDGQRLASASVDGIVKVWDASKSYLARDFSLGGELQTEPAQPSD